MAAIVCFRPCASDQLMVSHLVCHCCCCLCLRRQQLAMSLALDGARCAGKPQFRSVRLICTGNDISTAVAEGDRGAGADQMHAQKCRCHSNMYQVYKSAGCIREATPFPIHAQQHSVHHCLSRFFNVMMTIHLQRPAKLHQAKQGQNCK